MVRLILRLLGIRDYEVCPSCEVLKQQLAIVNAEKAELTSLILDIAKPKPIVPYESVRTPNMTQGVFARRQAELEARDRAAARARGSSFSADNLRKPSLEEVNETVQEIEREVKAQENAS